MASYFVACEPSSDGSHAVHDRTHCPPACFPAAGATEYLGEFVDARQAVAVARLRYACAARCAWSTGGATPPHRVEERALTLLRP